MHLTYTLSGIQHRDICTDPPFVASRLPISTSSLLSLRYYRCTPSRHTSLTFAWSPLAAKFHRFVKLFLQSLLSSIHPPHKYILINFTFSVPTVTTLCRRFLSSRFLLLANFTSFLINFYNASINTQHLFYTVHGTHARYLEIYFKSTELAFSISGISCSRRQSKRRDPPPTLPPSTTTLPGPFNSLSTISFEKYLTLSLLCLAALLSS